MTHESDYTIYFSEHFEVDSKALETYGALNASLVGDLPLFIDPFLLFNSKKPAYRQLHDEVIKYVRFLRDKAATGASDAGSLLAWYSFPEVRQTWLGYSVTGNRGTGLGMKFAKALNSNLGRVFSEFGERRISESEHLEKLCLFEDGVGRDNISDFTTNLIKGYLLDYTERFAKKHLRPDQVRRFSVPRARFNYSTEKWEPAAYELPRFGNDYVLLTPKDILTRDETWINKSDLLGNIEAVAASVDDAQLRAEINNYLSMRLKEVTRGRKKPTDKQRIAAMSGAIHEFPALIDYYIRWKEQNGERATSVSAEKVTMSEETLIRGVQAIADKLATAGFYGAEPDTIEEARRRVGYLKDFIEHQDGHRLFFTKGKPMRRESDVQLMFRLVWRGTPSDVNREVNNGRGPVDFKISRGSADKSLIEFKLAGNSKLEQNLKKQVPIYEKANDTRQSLKVIIFFTGDEQKKVNTILKRLELARNEDIVLIDARSDNKPSASKAK